MVPLTTIYMVLCSNLPMKYSWSLNIKFHEGGGRSDNFDDFICIFIFPPASHELCILIF